MENRERDRVSQRTTPTEAGQLNRSVEEEKGRRENSGTDAEFGQSIGRAENLSEGGEMNRNKDDMRNSNMGNESTRRSEMGDMNSSPGRNSGSDKVSGNEQSGGRSGNRNSGSSGIGDSSSGRH